MQLWSSQGCKYNRLKNMLQEFHYLLMPLEENNKKSEDPQKVTKVKTLMRRKRIPKKRSCIPIKEELLEQIVCGVLTCSCCAGHIKKCLLVLSQLRVFLFFRLRML